AYAAWSGGEPYAFERVGRGLLGRSRQQEEAALRAKYSTRALAQRRQPIRRAGGSRRRVARVHQSLRWSRRRRGHSLCSTRILREWRTGRIRGPSAGERSEHERGGKGRNR